MADEATDRVNLRQAFEGRQPSGTLSMSVRSPIETPYDRMLERFELGAQVPNVHTSRTPSAVDGNTKPVPDDRGQRTVNGHRQKIPGQPTSESGGVPVQSPYSIRCSPVNRGLAVPPGRPPG